MSIDWEVKVSDIIKAVLILISIGAYIVTTERWRQSVDDRFQAIEISASYNKQDRKEIKDSLVNIAGRLTVIEYKLQLHMKEKP